MLVPVQCTHSKENSRTITSIFFDIKIATRINNIHFALAYTFQSFVCLAYLSDHFLMTSYPDRPRLDYGYFVKRPPLGEGLKRLEKLSVWEPKVHIHVCFIF